MHWRTLLVSGVLALLGATVVGPMGAQGNTVTDPPAKEAAAPAADEKTDWDKLIDTQTGTLPIILTAPHGGHEKIEGVSARTGGVVVTDSNTDLLAKEVSAELEKLLGGKPYFVIARVSRKYVDLNRAEGEALESPKAAGYYHAFHHAIRQDVDAIRSRWPGHALLIDVHGQGVFLKSAVRGTRNGQTDKALLARAGKDAITGPKSIFGMLESAGYETRPACHSAEQTEERSFNGGYIVATYGSGSPDGIDAIQIESGTDLRSPAAARKKYAHALAEAIATFYHTYQESSEKLP